MCIKNEHSDKNESRTQRVWSSVTPTTFKRIERLAGREPISSFVRRVLDIGLDIVEAKQAAQASVAESEAE